jgi:hypothetical protein
LLKSILNTEVLGTVIFAAIFALGALRKIPSVQQFSWTILRRLIWSGALVVVLIAGFNYIVNPYGLYPPHLFKPAVVPSRLDKLAMWDALSQAPDIVIFGSSRSMQMPAAYIEKSTGRSAFNFAVNGAVPRDYLALIKSMIWRNKIPRAVILGLGYEQLNAYGDLNPVLEPGDPLLDIVPEASSLPLKRLQLLLSTAQVNSSVDSIFKTWVEHGIPDTFTAIGDVRQSNSEAAVQVLRDDAISTTYRRLLPDLSAQELGHLREFLQLCREHHIAVVIYFPPYFETLRDAYVTDPALSAMRLRFMTALDSIISQTYPETSVYDFTAASAVNGTPTMFTDAVHPNIMLGRLVLDKLLPSLSKRLSDVF